MFVSKAKTEPSGVLAVPRKDLDDKRSSLFRLVVSEEEEKSFISLTTHYCDC